MPCNAAACASVAIEKNSGLTADVKMLGVYIIINACGQEHAAAARKTFGNSDNRRSRFT